MGVSCGSLPWVPLHMAAGVFAPGVAAAAAAVCLVEAVAVALSPLTLGVQIPRRCLPQPGSKSSESRRDKRRRRSLDPAPRRCRAVPYLGHIRTHPAESSAARGRCRFLARPDQIFLPGTIEPAPAPALEHSHDSSWISTVQREGRNTERRIERRLYKEREREREETALDRDTKYTRGQAPKEERLDRSTQVQTKSGPSIPEETKRRETHQGAGTSILGRQVRDVANGKKKKKEKEKGKKMVKVTAAINFYFLSSSESTPPLLHSVQ